MGSLRTSHAIVAGKGSCTYRTTTFPSHHSKESKICIAKPRSGDVNATTTRYSICMCSSGQHLGDHKEGSFSMKGGEGPYSYAHNSRYQKEGLELERAIICEEIMKKLDVKKLCSSSDTFRMSDMGCSVGPNTFAIVESIIEAIESKRKLLHLNSEPLEYQVYFNDQVANDFNTLFKTLPPHRNYYAVGVPGSFYGRLYPTASLQFIHSSYAVQWLSRIPKQVMDSHSPAWNKGRIHYRTKEVEKAYAAQFALDLESFLDTRAEELVEDGFLVLLMPCIPNDADPSKCTLNVAFYLIGSCLMDMAKKGLVDEAKVDSFNLPTYQPRVAEVEGIIRKNGRFKVERMEELNRGMTDMRMSRSRIERYALCIRAGCEDLITAHFGTQIVEELFQHYIHKMIHSGPFSHSTYVPLMDLGLILKRK